MLQKVEERGAMETADRVLMLARKIWDYWLPAAKVQQRNITEGLKRRLTPYRGKTFAAIVDPDRFGDLLRAITGYKGGVIVRTALQLAPLLYQRPGNLREMEWAELDLDAALWTIPSAKMKRTKLEKEQGEAHTVPLPTQAVALLRNIHPLTGHGRYVFPGERSHDRPMSDNSVRSALYALGFGKDQTWHGLRASARTMMVDQLNLDPLAIEANLAHAVKDSNGRSYNRTQYVKQRFDQIQQWADYLVLARKPPNFQNLRCLIFKQIEFFKFLLTPTSKFAQSAAKPLRFLRFHPSHLPGVHCNRSISGQKLASMRQACPVSLADADSPV